jgi:two-component system, response regulator RegA
MSEAESTLATLLLVEDDQVLRQRLARALHERGLEVSTAGDLAGALAVARADPPELAVVDLKLPDGSGLDLVRQLKALEPTTSILVLTGFGSIANAVEAMKLGATHYLAKPADADQILAALGAGPGPAGTPAGGGATPMSLARAEWEHIQRVLTDVNGNVSEAARRLGIHRRSLQRKLGRFPPQR